MADRIRANPTAQRSAATTFLPGDAYEVDFTAPGSTPGTNCADSELVTITSGNVCNQVTLADYDIWAWKTAIESSGLPDGKGKVDYAFANGVATFDIEVNWVDRGETRLYQLRLQQ